MVTLILFWVNWVIECWTRKRLDQVATILMLFVVSLFVFVFVCVFVCHRWALVITSQQLLVSSSPIRFPSSSWPCSCCSSYLCSWTGKACTVWAGQSKCCWARAMPSLFGHFHVATIGVYYYVASWFPLPYQASCGCGFLNTIQGYN